MFEEAITHFIVGTAGHVDHGKTALIGALTGQDTDRLEEEHARGISIVLGFASYQPVTRKGMHIGIVDVPGHERFIKTMVAGATGMDAALFVVACDEGIKPQTREHLEILSLLGVRDGIIALTKSDLAESPEWIELVAEEVRDMVKGTFLEDAPIVPVSARSGEGLGHLKEALEDLLASLPERPSGSVFRLPVDRAFSVKGIGTVVTGTVWSGHVATGDPLVVQPGGEQTRVREIQQHGASVQRTSPATRTALALHGLHVEQVPAGSWLVPPGTLKPTRTVDLEVDYLPSAPGPLEHNQRVRIHHGTQETYGRIRLMGIDELPPGAEGFVQLHLEEPIVAVVGDRLLIRRYSPMRTIAGARVLDVDPPRHRRTAPETLDHLQTRAAGDPLDAVGLMVSGAGLHGVPLAEAARRSSADEVWLAQKASDRGWVVHAGLLVAADALATGLRDEVLPRLETLHRDHPMRRGLTTEALSTALGLPARHPVADLLLEWAEAEGGLSRDPPFWRIPGFTVALDGSRGEAADALSAAGRERGLLPWDRSEVEAAAAVALRGVGLKDTEAGELVEALVHTGRLVRYPDGFVITTEGEAELQRRVCEHLAETGELTVSDFRSLSDGLTRKYAIPILEYYDTVGITEREGDIRIPGPAFEESGR